MRQIKTSCLLTDSTDSPPNFYTFKSYKVTPTRDSEFSLRLKDINGGPFRRMNWFGFDNTSTYTRRWWHSSYTTPLVRKGCNGPQWRSLDS